MSWLTFACQHLPGVTVISVGGELDATNEGSLSAFVRDARREPGDHVVFDLSEVHFMDSAGLRVLLNTYTYSQKHGGSVHLAALQPMPARLMEITRIVSHIPVHTTLEDALTIVLSPPRSPHLPASGDDGSIRQ
jgi:anti-anti-sigma factor